MTFKQSLDCTNIATLTFPNQKKTKTSCTCLFGSQNTNIKMGKIMASKWVAHNNY